MIIVGGTSGLVAALNTSDPEHEAARTAMHQAALTVVSPLVILEIGRITTRNVDRKAAHMVNDWLPAQERTGRLTIPALSADTPRRARTVQNRYAALRLDLTDAVNVILAEAFDTEVILTLGRRDFRTVTPLTGNHAFRLLPDDL
ncbi:type II toxin-antitoxin system VapC family toxin [Streptomyces axinellae]|uniref:PIN domain-containing protein n=1 Tax=Streptomyces axinellae TaxID=552788 RepID=A0ABN3Q064_9ACTN